MYDAVTRQLVRAGKAIKPLGMKTARVLLISCFVVVLLAEVNQGCDGIVATIGEWVWDNVLAYKTVNFGLGMLITYLIMTHMRKRVEATVRGKFMQTAPIKMDLEALEQHAKEHGIQLDLQADPKISKRNAVEVEQKIDTTTPLRSTTPDAPPPPPKGKKNKG